MSSNEFKPGDRVLHPLFGAGMIRVVSGSGAQARLTVDFSSQIGTKKLVAGMAKGEAVFHEPPARCGFGLS